MAESNGWEAPNFAIFRSGVQDASVQRQGHAKESKYIVLGWLIWVLWTRWARSMGDEQGSKAPVHSYLDLEGALGASGSAVDTRSGTSRVTSEEGVLVEDNDASSTLENGVGGRESAQTSSDDNHLRTFSVHVDSFYSSNNGTNTR